MQYSEKNTFGRYCLFVSGGIVIGTKSSDTSAPAPKLYQHQRVIRFNVEPDEEWLVVRLELDLEQGGVHPQGENVLRWNYWLVITHNVIPRKSTKIRFNTTITCVARGKPSSSSSRSELTWRWIIIKLSLSLSLTYSAAPSSSQMLPSWSHCHRCYEWYFGGVRDKIGDQWWNSPDLSLLHWPPPPPATNIFHSMLLVNGET